MLSDLEKPCYVAMREKIPHATCHASTHTVTVARRNPVLVAVREEHHSLSPVENKAT